MNKIIEAEFFPQARRESGAKQLAAQLSSGVLDASTARTAQFFNPPPEAPAVAPEKALAIGVLKQAAHDLRRFHCATTGFGRELYLDAYSWIAANDFSWPYSFVNVCKLLHLCPEVIRTELLADASLGWFRYWTRRCGRFAQTLPTYLSRAFARTRSSQTVETDWSSPSLQLQ
jgi:hypothetical protein